jgi:RHS repeat-associated protein
MNNNELHKKLLGDRASTSLSTSLGSSSVTTDANGVKTASALYKAFGETRYTLGNLGTDYHFTGQRNEAALGIYYFNARWYDGSLGRFLSPDSIVPTGTQGTQAWDRYAYVNNNPVRYTDPTGHCIFCILFPFVLSFCTSHHFRGENRRLRPLL